MRNALIYKGLTMPKRVLCRDFQCIPARMDRQNLPVVKGVKGFVNHYFPIFKGKREG